MLQNNNQMHTEVSLQLYLHKKIAEVVSKRLQYLLNGALIHAELYRSSLPKKSSSQFASAMAIKKVAKSASETTVSIDQFPRFIQMRGLFGDTEARWLALNGKTNAAG